MLSSLVSDTRLVNHLVSFFQNTVCSAVTRIRKLFLDYLKMNGHLTARLFEKDVTEVGQVKNYRFLADLTLHFEKSFG